MSETKFEDKYLAEKRIKIVEDAGATRSGSKLVKVTFNDGSTEIWAEKMLAADGVATPKQSDASGLRLKRAYPVVNAILTVMLDYNIRWDELQFILQLVPTSLNSNEDRATAHLWGVPTLGERTMDQVDRVMEKIPNKVTLEDFLSKKK